MSAHLPERSLQFPSMCKDGYRLLAVRGHTWCIRKPRQVLKIFQQNIRSILWKFNKIITLIESCNITFDALTFTETWNGENSDNFILPHYNRLFKLEKKKNSRGDGVPRQAAVPGFYMLHEFSTITSDTEVLCTTKNKNVFTVLYRPPCGNILTFLKFLDSSLSCTNENKWLLTRGGDMNIDVQKGSSSANDFCLSYRVTVFRML